MSLPLCLLATLLALAPALLPAELAAALGRGSRLALSVLPFVALAGLPGSSMPRARTWPLVLAAALPSAALAAWLDVRNGWEAETLAGTAGVAALLIALLGEASHRARGRAAHALVWLALVPGLPAAMAALVWVAGARTGLGALLARLYDASPVGWAMGRVDAPAPLATSLLPLAGALGLLVLARLPAEVRR